MQWRDVIFQELQTLKNQIAVPSDNVNNTIIIVLSKGSCINMSRLLKWAGHAFGKAERGTSSASGSS